MIDIVLMDKEIGTCTVRSFTFDGTANYINCFLYPEFMEKHDELKNINFPCLDVSFSVENSHLLFLFYNKKINERKSVYISVIDLIKK